MCNSHRLRKIISPTLPHTILHRASLVAKLNEFVCGTSLERLESSPCYKLILVCAPAGYGKTTLLADFARHTMTACCWYLLEPADTDKTTFLTYLLASIRHRFPTFCPSLDSLLEGLGTIDTDHSVHVQTFEAIIDILAAAMTTEIPEHFALILCNYHEVNENKVVNACMNRLLRQLPARCTVIIESRVRPDLELAPLLAHLEVAGISSDLLRFTPHELQELAVIQGTDQFDEQEATRLAETFDGWITGLLIGTRLGDIHLTLFRQSVSPEPTASPRQLQRQHLLAYFANEVFKNDLATRSFLQEILVLQHLTPAFCNALAGITDAAERLQRLEWQGFFLTSIEDGSQIVYVCHPLLRQLLNEDLYQQAPDLFTILHLRAANIMRSVHLYKQAIYHAFQARSDDLAIELIRECTPDLLNQHQARSIADWIDTLPPTTTAHQPELLLIRASIYLTEHAYTQALALLDTALTTPGQFSPSSLDTQRLSAEIAMTKCLALLSLGDYRLAQTVYQETLAQILPDDTQLQALTVTYLGIYTQFSGDFMAGIAYLQKALQLWEHLPGQPRYVLQVHRGLASMYSAIDNFTLAEYHLARSIACETDCPGSYDRVYNLICKGAMKQRQGLYSEAETCFSRALTLARSPLLFQRGEALALIQLGDLYQDQKLYAQSLTTTGEGLALARRIGDTGMIQSALCTLALTYLFAEDTSTASLLITEPDSLASTDTDIDCQQLRYLLSYGTILLWQNQYDQAYHYLTRVATALNTICLQREQLQVLLRLAACQVANGQIRESVRYLAQVGSILFVHEHYHQVVLTELHRFPELLYIVNTLPEMDALRSALHLELSLSPSKETPHQPVLTPVSTRQPELKIQALGEPMVIREGNRLTGWRMARAMELFFFLLDRGSPQRKEQIISALWPEADDPIDQTFRSTIYYLRKTVGESCVVSHHGTYTLNLASHYENQVWYDVAAFKKHYMKAKQATTNDTAKTEFTQMIDLYCGDYVQPFNGDWCRFRRDELCQTYLEARKQLAQIAWSKGELDECMLHWQQMLAMDNCLEDAHYGLMRCYLRQHKRGQALRQYQRCRDVLQAELSVLPGSAIQNLYNRLTC